MEDRESNVTSMKTFVPYKISTCAASSTGMHGNSVSCRAGQDRVLVPPPEHPVTFMQGATEPRGRTPTNNSSQDSIIILGRHSQSRRAPPPQASYPRSVLQKTHSNTTTARAGVKVRRTDLFSFLLPHDKIGTVEEGNGWRGG